MMRRSKKHRLFAKRNAGFEMLEDSFDEIVGLLIFVGERGENGLLISAAMGEEIFVVAIGAQRNDGIGGVKNGLDRAVILLELENGGGWINRRKIENVMHGRGAEGIDRLR